MYTCNPHNENKEFVVHKIIKLILKNTKITQKSIKQHNKIILEIPNFNYSLKISVFSFISLLFQFFFNTFSHMSINLVHSGFCVQPLVDQIDIPEKNQLKTW